MKKLLMAVIGTLMVSAVALTSAQATTYSGQIEGGDIYTVKNVSQNGAYADSTNAICGETVKFRLKIHNPGPVALENVKVTVTLPSQAATSQSSKATVTASNANPASTSDTAGVKLDKAGTLSYIAGSAEYFDPSGNRLGSLSDSIVTTGADVPGGVGVSTQQKRYVALQAKVNCPEVPKDIQVCELATKKIITIREDQFDASKHSKNLNDCKEVVKYIKVCELATKKIISIDEKTFDATKHSKDLKDCAEKPPVPGEIVVCETATKKIVTIKENEFDASKHSKTLADCNITPVPETPTELPQTGAEGVVAIVAALLTAAAGYVVTSRKNVLG